MNRALGKSRVRWSRILPLLLAGMFLASGVQAKPKMVSGKKAKWVDQPEIIVGESKVDREDQALSTAKADALIQALELLGTHKNLTVFREYYIAKFTGAEAEAVLGDVAREYLDLVEANHTLAYTEVQGWKDGKQSWFVGLAGYTIADSSQAWQKAFAEKYLAEGQKVAEAAKNATAGGDYYGGLAKSAEAFMIYDGLLGAFGEAHPEFPQITDLQMDAEMELGMKLDKLSVWPVAKRKYLSQEDLPKMLNISVSYSTPEGAVQLAGVPFNWKAADGLTVAVSGTELVSGDDGKATLTLQKMEVSGPAGIDIAPVLPHLTSAFMKSLPSAKFEFIDKASGKTFNVDSAPMALIDADSVLLGASSDDPLKQDDEVPAVEVKVTPFYMDVHEVTNAQYKAFLDATGYKGESRFSDIGELNADDHPVVGVTLRDAYAYAMWAGKRLPSEAEWELAASGPEGLVYPWGNGFDPSKCANQANSTTPMAPGTFPGDSPYGIKDLAGNVWEWTADGYDWEMLKKQSAGMMYMSPEAKDLRSIRGGSYKSGPADLRTSNRLGMNPAARTDDIGFRCVRDAN
ncbi:MAG: SUMF1/EgtB/PvdO family nonheme iron enzyme [bacterium]